MCLFPTKGGFPCGKCIDCLSKKRDDWSIRLQIEYNYWFVRGCKSYMGLLTYDPQHVPLTSSGNMSLRMRDVQLFFKRLRKRLQKEGVFIRYFYCGEYGPKCGRPHYHFIIFGFPESWSRKKVFDMVQKSWDLGFVGNKFAPVKGERGMHYCTKYMINKALKLKDYEQEKPFNKMSKGLGMSYVFAVDEDARGIHKGRKLLDVEKTRKPLGDVDLTDLVMKVRACTSESEEIQLAEYIKSRYLDTIWINGTKFKLPRYLRNALFDAGERFLINFADYVLYHRPREREYFAKYGDYDATHDVPMKMLMAMEKTNRLLSKFIKESKD